MTPRVVQVVQDLHLLLEGQQRVGLGECALCRDPPFLDGGEQRIGYCLSRRRRKPGYGSA